MGSKKQEGKCGKNFFLGWESVERSLGLAEPGFALVQQNSGSWLLVKRGEGERNIQYSTVQYIRLWEMERMTGHKKPCFSRPQFNTFIDKN